MLRGWPVLAQRARTVLQVAKAYPRRKLHLVVHNYATHNHPIVRAWLARNTRITLHFTPTSGSWLNMVEIFFSIITRQAIRRGSFGSVTDLIAAISTFIDGWNERCQPFVWAQPADDLLDHWRPDQEPRFAVSQSSLAVNISGLDIVRTPEVFSTDPHLEVACMLGIE